MKARSQPMREAWVHGVPGFRAVGRSHRVAAWRSIIAIDAIGGPSGLQTTGTALFRRHAHSDKRSRRRIWQPWFHPARLPQPYRKIHYSTNLQQADSCNHWDSQYSGNHRAPLALLLLDLRLLSLDFLLHLRRTLLDRLGRRLGFVQIHAVMGRIVGRALYREQAGAVAALHDTLNVPRIEAKVSSACDSRLAKAVLAWLLRKGFLDKVWRWALRSLPSPDDRR